MSHGWQHRLPRTNHDLTLTNRHARWRRLREAFRRSLRGYSPRFDSRYL